MSEKSHPGFSIFYLMMVFAGESECFFGFEGCISASGHRCMEEAVAAPEKEQPVDPDLGVEESESELLVD